MPSARSAGVATASGLYENRLHACLINVAISVLLTLSFCAGRQDLALPLASFWLRLCRAMLMSFFTVGYSCTLGVSGGPSHSTHPQRGQISFESRMLPASAVSASAPRDLSIPHDFCGFRVGASDDLPS